VIYQVIQSNTNGISGKATNKPQIYLLFNEAYQTFHQFFDVWSKICY